MSDHPSLAVQAARIAARAAVWLAAICAAQPTLAFEPKLVEVARGLVNPWAFAFLPDGRILVSERGGQLRYINVDGSLSAPLKGLPPIAVGGQGGLLDVLLSPEFAKDKTVFFSFAEPHEGMARTTVARAVLGDEGLSNVRSIFRQSPAMGDGYHFGSRLVFGRDGNLWITLGDRYGGALRAQDLTSHFGKVVRIRPDGKVPNDNPYVKVKGALPEIWSIGHRNLQGAAMHPQTGELWTHEHGARGGDEVNLTQPGKNYGWPIITWGVDYSGEKIGEGTTKDGLEQPLHYWLPSIAPSGMTFCSCERYPPWRDSLFIGSLKFGFLARLSHDGSKVTGEERLFEEIGQRVRDVRVSPDGHVYLLTDNRNGRLLKIVP